MRKRLIILVSFIFILATTSNIIAQNNPIFRGVINFKMEARGNLSDAEKSQIEGTVVSTYGEGVYKTETKTSMMSQTQIFYADSIITMTEVMGQQFAFRMTTEEAKTMQPTKNDNPPDVSFINETKEIAGYVCHKAEIALNDDIIEIFFSKDYTLSDFMVEDNFKKLKGLPLEYTINVPGKEDVSIHMIATSVKKKKIKAKEFKIPEGIKVMSFEELQAMMGQ